MHPGDPHAPPPVPGDCLQTGRDTGQSALASPVWGASGPAPRGPAWRVTVAREARPCT